MTQQEQTIQKMLYSANQKDVDLALLMLDKNKGEFDIDEILGIVKIEPGKFLKGEDKKLTIIDDPYYIGKWNVTQGIWKAVMGNNPSSYTDDIRIPVDNFLWNDMLKFLDELKKITGVGYRISTDTEWEYAADGAQFMPIGEDGMPIQDIWAGFNDIKDATKYAWCAENSGGRPHPVGELLPNKAGLYDMSGNYFELVVDEVMDVNDYFKYRV